MNDLKKKMDTTKLDLEALDATGKGIEYVLSEKISTPREDEEDSEIMPSHLLNDEGEDVNYRNSNSEKIPGGGKIDSKLYKSHKNK